MYFTGIDISIVDFANWEEADMSLSADSSTARHEQLRGEKKVFVCSQNMTQQNLSPCVETQENSKMMQ